MINKLSLNQSDELIDGHVFFSEKPCCLYSCPKSCICDVVNSGDLTYCSLTFVDYLFITLPDMTGCFLMLIEKPRFTFMRWPVASCQYNINILLHFAHSKLTGCLFFVCIPLQPRKLGQILVFPLISCLCHWSNIQGSFFSLLRNHESSIIL